MRVLCVRFAVSKWRGSAGILIDRKESEAEKSSYTENARVCSTWVTSTGVVTSCSRRFVNSILRASWRNGRTRSIERQRDLHVLDQDQEPIVFAGGGPR